MGGKPCEVQTLLQRDMKSWRVKGAQLVDVRYEKRGAFGGTFALTRVCCSMAAKGHVRWGRAVTDMEAPSSFVVLVQGMRKDAARDELGRTKMTSGRTERETCLRGSKRLGLGMTSSPKRQQHQKAVNATAPTAQSKGSEKERLSKRMESASIVTGGRLARRADGGTIFEKPHLV